MPARGRATILDPLLFLLRGFLGTPAWRTLLKPYFDMWTAVDIWVGTHVFKVPGLGTAQFIPGSETVLEYFHWFTLLVLAGLTTLVWSLLDRRRTNYKELHDWTRILVRYQLAMSLFSYGFMKVFPVQFQTFYGLARLMEPFGEFSRSGVLWNFMAVSIPYTVFSGAAEVAAGFLLLFRRTTTLGALISFPVLLNVVLLNIFYDVGVKISSTHMLLMSVFLLVPVLGRLINVAVLNRAAEPIDLNGPNIQRRGWCIASRVAGVVFIGLYLLNGANPSSIPAQWGQYKAVYVTPARSPLYGLYRVESGGPTGWYKVAIDGPGRIAVRMMDDTVQWFSTDYNPANSTVVLNKKVGLASLLWSRPELGHLVLEGTYKDAPISMHLRRIDKELRLPNSRFEWVSDETNWNK